MSKRLLSALLVAPLAVASVPRAMADVSFAGFQEASNFDVFFADQYTVDNNLFRLPANPAEAALLIATPNTVRKDRLNSASFGLDDLWTYGLQKVTVGLRIDDNRFAHNGDLDNTSASEKLIWDWQAGPQLGGELGATHGRSLDNFITTRYTGKDLVDDSEFFASSRLQLGPHWAALGALRESDLTHSAPAALYDNSKSKIGTAGIEYASAVEDTYELEYRFNHTRLPKDAFLAGNLFDQDYNENTLRVLTKYALTGKTTLNASAGYLKRDYPNDPAGAFSGVIGRGSLSWSPSAKTQVVATGWHELDSYLGAQSDYFVSNGGSLSPVWNASEKLVLALVLSHEHQKYIPSSASVLTLGSRTDTVTGALANAVYYPSQNLSLNVSARFYRRDSNQPEFPYDDTLVSAGFTFKFLGGGTAWKCCTQISNLSY